MNVVGVIPARWGSTRLPGKSLINICGKPLIQWVIESALRSKNIDRLIVATDDKRISDFVESLGVKSVMTRTDHPSGTDRIAEAIQDYTVDIVVNIQGDEPLIDPVIIDNLVDKMIYNDQWDMATVAVPIDNTDDLNNTSVVKVVCGENGQALYFSRSVIPFIRDSDFDSSESMVYLRHIGLYVYRRVFLDKLVKTEPCMIENMEKLEQLRALYIGGRILVVETGDIGLGVDTPEDLERIAEIIRKRVDL